MSFLALFERRTGELFTDTPGSLVGSRVLGLSMVLSYVAKAGLCALPLKKISVRGTSCWNRQLKVSMDVEIWRRNVEAAEAHSAPVPRLRQQMADADAGLAEWIKGHRYLVPTDVENGESGVALLLLWEVDHKRKFPS